MIETFQGSKAAVFIGDRLLVLLRDDRAGLPYPAHWDFPGGGREGDETGFQTLRREIEEEVGLDAAEGGLLWSRRLPAARAGEFTWFFVLRFPSAAVGRILFGDEGTAWALMPPERYRTLPRAIPSLVAKLELWLAETGR